MAKAAGPDGLKPAYLDVVVEKITEERQEALKMFLMEYVRGLFLVCSSMHGRLSKPDKGIRPLRLKNPLNQLCNKYVIAKDVAPIREHLEPRQVVKALLGSSSLL